MVRQNSCVVPFGITASVIALPAAPPAPAEGCFDPASPPPLQADAASARSSAAIAGRRVVLNVSLQRVEGIRRNWGSGRDECTGASARAAALEHDDALHVVWAAMIAGKRSGHGVERWIPVGDERRDVDRPALDQLQRARVSDGATSGIVTARCAGGRHERRLEKLDVVQHAQVHSAMTMPVQKDRGLLANERRYRRKQLPGSGRLNEELGASAVSAL